MRLTFIGAAGEVTGSATLIDTGRSRVLVDFGMFQGSPVAESRNRRPPDGGLSPLDAVVLTHAHIDHAGRLPLLVRDAAKGGGGYRGPIWATPATIELSAMMLRDSAEIQESDTARWMRARTRRGRVAPAAPMYTVADVEQALRQMRPLPYEQAQEIAPGVSLYFIDAGHILGSASARLHCRSAGQERTIVFSGDIGVPGSPILRDPRTFDAADTVILESTYGDRNHRPMDQTIDELSGVLSICKQGCGKILIPAFAVGRTQTLIYLIGRLREEGKAPRFPVYVDSPMASEATTLYRGHSELYDTISREMLDQGDGPLTFPGLRFTRSGDESRRLNDMEGPIAIISASGMCTAGRILHHLRHNLWKESTHVLFVGYQGQGTLGRALVEGAKNVRIMHEPIAVKARIHTIGGLSAHAGQDQLAAWMKPLAGGKPRILLNHGENLPRQALRQRLLKDYNLDAATPQREETVEV
jgi:metallo-beta-lactamase family protein